MEQFEKVCKGLECCILRDPDDRPQCGECSYNHHEISNAPCPNRLKADALALIRQQQERIAELEANRDAVASKTSDLVGYLANLATTTKYFHGDHVDIPLDVYAECVFRLNKYYKRCEELEAELGAMGR